MPRKKSKDPKVGTGKKPKVLVVDYILTRTQRILLELSMQLFKMHETQYERLKILKSLLPERYKYSL